MMKEAAMAAEPVPEVAIGQITHFFSQIGVGIIKLTAPLHLGDRIHIVGHTTDFVQTVDSMQIEHMDVSTAKAGDSVGILVSRMVREGDQVYLMKGI
jgi:hypothetical protein